MKKTAKINVTLMSPSAEPVAKNSSPGSKAIHLTAESCAWKRSRWIRCLMSNMNTSPFFPPVRTSWFCGAYMIDAAPWCSWHANDVTAHFFVGIKVSQRTTFRWSVEWPAVINSDDEPKKVKSLAVLLWPWTLYEEKEIKCETKWKTHKRIIIRKMVCNCCWKPLATSWDFHHYRWRRICFLVG